MDFLLQREILGTLGRAYVIQVVCVGVYLGVLLSRGTQLFPLIVANLQNILMYRETPNLMRYDWIFLWI